MKISKLFHWLYCAVMFLPLFCLPVYALAVRSDNNYEPISINTGGYEYHNKFDTNDVNNVNDIFSNNLYHFDNFSLSSFGNLDGSYFFSLYILHFDNMQLTNYQFECEEINYVDFDITNNYFLVEYNLENDDFYLYVNYTASNTWARCLYDDDTEVLTFTNIDFYITETSINDFKTYLSSNNILPSSSDFNVIEYTYNEAITYNDTDFGSQTIYTLYKEVDDYFNYDNVLNIGELYDWCNINLFNGNASLGFFIFFHLLEYWLLTSLLWLIFDILMYVPQLCHRWLDKASLE